MLWLCCYCSYFDLFIYACKGRGLRATAISFPLSHAYVQETNTCHTNILVGASLHSVTPHRTSHHASLNVQISSSKQFFTVSILVGNFLQKQNKKYMPHNNIGLNFNPLGSSQFYEKRLRNIAIAFHSISNEFHRFQTLFCSISFHFLFYFVNQLTEPLCECAKAKM